MIGVKYLARYGLISILFIGFSVSANPGGDNPVERNINEQARSNDSFERPVCFQDLPNEVLQYILSFLNKTEKGKVQRVSKKMQLQTIAQMANEGYFLELSSRRAAYWCSLLDFTTNKQVLERAETEFTNQSQEPPFKKQKTSAPTQLRTQEDVNVKVQQAEYLRNMLSLLRSIKIEKSVFDAIEASYSGFSNMRRHSCVIPRYSAPDDYQFAELISCCRALKRLAFWESSAVTNNRVSGLVRKCPQLEWISVPGCGNVGDEGLRAIGLHCPNLKHLDIGNCSAVTDNGICALVYKYPQLEHINLSYCHQLTGEAIREIGLRCVKLQTVNLERCYEITDEEVCALVNGLSDLKELNLYCCCDLTDKTLKKLGECCPKLRKLDFSSERADQQDGNTDAGVLALVSGCKDLEELCISSDASQRIFTDQAIYAILENCPKLRELEIIQCGGLTHGSFVALAQATSLESLNIFNCNRFREVDLMLLSHSKSLKSIIIVSNEESFSEDYIYSLRTLKPNLSISDLSEG